MHSPHLPKAKWILVEGISKKSGAIPLQCETGVETEWLEGFLEKKDSGIKGCEKYLKQFWDEPLFWWLNITMFFLTFINWLQLEILDYGEVIWPQCLEMIVKKSVSDIWEWRKNATQGKKWPAMDSAKHIVKKARSNLPELSNTIFIIEVC